MADIAVAKPFMLTLDDGTMLSFEPGTYSDVGDDIASHWYVQAHLVDAAAPAHAPGSIAAFMAESRAAVDAQRAKATEDKRKAAEVAAARAKESELVRAGLVKPFGKAAK